MQIAYSLTTKQKDSEVSHVLRYISSKRAIDLLSLCAPLQQKSENNEVQINIVGSKRMLQLNSQYREKQSSTDVLSFELYEAGVMGELYICPDDIDKNAKALNHTFENELLEIIIHGMLHLTGYDHSDAMFDWQKKLTDSILKDYENYRRTR